MVDVNCINTYEVPTTNRERTMPLQPAFSATNTVLRSNVTGDGTAYTVICNNEILDQNGDYNNATGVFTAPVTGFYLLAASVFLQDLAINGLDGKLVFSLNSGTDSFAGFEADYGRMADSGDNVIINITGGAYLTAADTVEVEVIVANTTKTIDVLDTNLTYFSGALVV